MAEPNAPTSRQSSGRRNQTEKIALLKSRFSSARQLRQTWQTQYHLDDLHQKFLGLETVAWSDFEHTEFAVNKFWPTVKTLLPSLFLQNPFFTVRSKDESRQPDSLLMAQMAEAGLKAIAQQENHLEFSVKLALLQSFFSIGVLKASYQPRLRRNPRAGDPMFETINGTPVLDPQTQQLIELIDEETGEPLTEPNQIMDDEVYRWDWVNGDKMLLPDAGPDHLRWPWIAEEITVLLEDAREDTRFSSNIRSQLKDNTSGQDDLGRLGSRPGFGEMAGESSRQGDKWITYIEYWDIRRRRQTIWADGQSFSQTRFLLDRNYPDGVEEHPYSLLKGFTPIIAPKPSPWPVPHVWNWLSLQVEYSSRRQQGAIAAKRSARKIYYDEGTFPDAEFAVAALQSATDMEGVKINDITRPPQALADPPPPANINQDLVFLEADWNRTTGVGLPRGRNTATEARIEEASGEARDLDMRHDVNVWLETSARKMLQLMRGTLTLGLYVKMRGASDRLYLSYIARHYGPEFAQNIQEFPQLRQAFDDQFGDDRWQLLTREQLEFQADVSIAPGSARPRNMETEKQDFMQIVGLLGSVPILTQSRALLLRVSEMFEFFDAAMIDEILAASQRAQQIEAVQAGRLQGNDARPAAEGGGANVSEFRRQFTG